MSLLNLPKHICFIGSGNLKATSKLKGMTEAEIADRSVLCVRFYRPYIDTFLVLVFRLSLVFFSAYPADQDLAY